NWQIAIRQTIALVDPHLDTDDAVGCFSFAETVVDICAQCVEWHATFAIPFFTCDVDTVQTTGRHDLDTLCAEEHRVLHRTLHCTTEHDAFFQLLCNRISDQLCIGFRLANFFDIHMNRHAHHFGQRGFQHFNVFTLFTDHDTRT